MMIIWPQTLVLVSSTVSLFYLSSAIFLILTHKIFASFSYEPFSLLSAFEIADCKPASLRQQRDYLKQRFANRLTEKTNISTLTDGF